MEFFIKKNATLPLLKMQVVKDGRSDYDKFMDMIEESSIFFSMVNVENGNPKISTKPAGFVERTELNPDAKPEYYIYYQFTLQDTNTVGRFEGQFLLRNSDGVLILPIRDRLFINIQESYIANDLEQDGCYTLSFPCCGASWITPTPTPTPSVTPDNNVYLLVSDNINTIINPAPTPSAT